MIDAVFILAGGRGSRLQPWHAPKALMPLGGKPIVQRLIEHVGIWVDSVVICLGYRGSDIKAALHDRQWSLRGGLDFAKFSDGDVDEPMCSRVVQARKKFGITGRTLTCYGDEMADVDLKALEISHEKSGAVLTFVGHHTVLPFGVVKDGKIDSGETVLANIGFFLAEPEAWEHIHEEDGLAEWVGRLFLAGKPVRCFIHTGRRATINSLADLEHAEKVWGVS